MVATWFSTWPPRSGRAVAGMGVTKWRRSTSKALAMSCAGLAPQSWRRRQLCMARGRTTRCQWTRRMRPGQTRSALTPPKSSRLSGFAQTRPLVGWLRGFAPCSAPMPMPRVSRAVRGYRLAVPAIKGASQAVQWFDEGDAVGGLLAAGRDLLGSGRSAGQVVNLATTDWLSAADVARLARSRVVTLPRGALLATSDLGRRLGLSPFGADRAVLIGGPLALSAGKAAQLLGWRPAKGSEQVMSEALSRDWHRSPLNRRL